MSRNYVLNTGNGVSLFVSSNQNFGFHTNEPSEKLSFDQGNARFNSNVYVMRRMGVSTATPTVELDVSGDAKVSGTFTVGGSVSMGNAMLMNGFYVTKSSNATLSTALSAAVQNMDVSTTGTTLSLVNTSQRFQFVATASQVPLLTIPASRTRTVLNMPLQVTGDILPSSNLVYNLGSSNARFKDLFLSGNSISLGNIIISSDSNSGTVSLQNTTTSTPASISAKELVISDSGQILKLKAQAGQLRIVSMSNNLELTDVSSTPANLFAFNSNIGIGVSNPSSRLHVSDDALISTSRVGSHPLDRTLATFSHCNVAVTTGYAVMQSSVGDTFVNAPTGRSVRFRINNNDAVTMNSQGFIGINTTSPSASLHLNTTDAIILPTGTTVQRPSVLQQGMIRYNTSLNTFEGYGAGNAWGGLGGVRDTNQDTYISPESFPTSNDDVLRFFNSNLETCRITRAGRMGIGTITPSELLDVAGNINASSNMYAGNACGIGTTTPSEGLHCVTKVFAAVQHLGSVNDSVMVPSFSFRENSNTGMYHPANNTIAFTTSGSERVRVTNTGVGIFNTAPQEALHVTGKTFTTNQVLGYAPDSSNVPAFSWTNDSNTGLYRPTFCNIGFVVGGSERMRLTNTGNLGIGTTTSPGLRLEVQGSSAFYDTSIATSVLTNGNELKMRNDGFNNWSFFNTTSSGFQINNTSGTSSLGTSGTNVMTITSGNNVGISTTSPSYKLHVVGDIYATQDVIAFSDKRYKTAVEDIQEPLSVIENLKGVFYQRVDDTTHRRQVGFLAQDVAQVLPEVVRYDSNNDLYGLNYGQICAVLVEAVKRLSQEIKVLKNERSMS